jgi:hypothetical protein
LCVLCDHYLCELLGEAGGAVAVVSRLLCGLCDALLRTAQLLVRTGRSLHRRRAVAHLTPTNTVNQTTNL